MLRKKVLEPGDIQVPHSTWGQEVTVKMQGVLEDRTVVEKDCKLVFVIGEGDVIQVIFNCFSLNIQLVCVTSYIPNRKKVNKSIPIS